MDGKANPWWCKGDVSRQVLKQKGNPRYSWTLVATRWSSDIASEGEMGWKARCGHILEIKCWVMICLRSCHFCKESTHPHPTGWQSMGKPWPTAESSDQLFSNTRNNIPTHMMREVWDGWDVYLAESMHRGAQHQWRIAGRVNGGGRVSSGQKWQRK